MRKYKFSGEFACVLILLLSVFETGQTQVSKYFPLHVGDYWVQHSDSMAGQFKPTTMRRQINGTDLIQGATYYRMMESMRSDDGTNNSRWYSWLRIQNNAILIGAFGNDSTIVQFQIPTQTITVDGNIADWGSIAPLTNDPQGDDTLSYPGADIKAVFAAHDANNLYLRMDLWDNVNTNFRNGYPPEDGRYTFRIENNGPYPDMEAGIAYDANNSQWSLGFNGSNSGMPTGLEGPSYVGVSGSHIELRLPLTMIGNPSKYDAIEGRVVNYYYQYGTELDVAGVSATQIFNPPLEYIPAQAAQIGATWQFNVEEMGGLLIFRVNDTGLTIETPAGTFNDCIQLQLTIIDQTGDTSQVSSMYLADGIGEVRNSGWQLNMNAFDFVLTDYAVQQANPIQVSQQTQPVSGQNLALSVSPPQNFQPTTSYLYYRFPGEKTWSTNHRIALTAAGANYDAIIPSSLITYRGIEYYIELDNGIEKIYYPETNPQNSPATIQVKIDHYQPALSLQGGVYKMISVPMELTDKSVWSVLGDDYRVYDPQSWRLFRWQPGDSAYVEYPAIRSIFTPGTAFWLVTRWGENFDVENGLSMDTSQPFELLLEPGWNQVANPFPFPIATDSCKADTTVVERPVSYDGQQYHYDVAVVDPWEGYFVYNSGSTVAHILIPPIAVTSGLPKYKSRINIDNEQESFIHLAAEMPGTLLKDTENYIGFLEKANQGTDPFDFCEPPPIGEFLQLSIVENNQCYAGNFKPVSKDGDCWHIAISSTVFQKAVEIHLHQTGYLPENFQYYLLDEDYGCRIPIQNNALQLFVTKEIPQRHMKLIVGTAQYAEENRDDIPLTPLEFSLAQNYPNPFNSATAIRYQLGKRSHVVIEIYNLMGQKVRSLVNQVQPTGEYQLTWDGVDNFNRQVASGMYFCQMKADEFSKSKKLLLVR